MEISPAPGKCAAVCPLWPPQPRAKLERACLHAVFASFSMARTLFRQLGSWISGVRTRQAGHNGVSAFSPSLRQNSRVADARLLCVVAGVAASVSSATLGFHSLRCDGSIHPSPHTASTGAASGSPTERGLDSKTIDGRAVAAQTRLHVASTVAEMRRCYGKVTHVHSCVLTRSP